MSGYFKLKNNPVELLSDFCLLIVGVFSFFPYAKIFGNSEWILLIAGFCCFFLCLSTNPRFFTVVPLRRALCYVLVIYTCFAPYVYGNGVIGNRYTTTILLLLGPIIFEFYASMGRMQSLKKIVIIVLFFAEITWITTAQALVTNSWVVRSIKSGTASLNIYRQGIGGYEFIYFCSVIAPCLLFLFLKEKAVPKRVIALVGWIECFVIAVMANYTTAMITVLISSIIVFFYVIKSKPLRVLFCIIGLLVFFFGESLIYSFLNIVAILSDEGRISNLLGTGSNVWMSFVEEFFIDRFPTMMESINTWFDNFFFGAVAGRIETSGSFLVGFGQHSFVLDTLALFGTLVGIPYIICTFAPFFTKSKSDECAMLKQSPLRIPVFVAYLIVLLFNNAAQSLAFAVSFVYPVLALVIQQKAKDVVKQSDEKSRKLYSAMY